MLDENGAHFALAGSIVDNEDSATVRGLRLDYSADTPDCLQIEIADNEGYDQTYAYLTATELINLAEAVANHKDAHISGVRVVTTTRAAVKIFIDGDDTHHAYIKAVGRRHLAGVLIQTAARIRAVEMA